MRAALFIVLMLLTGCATTRDVVVKTEVKEVPKVVVERCLAVAEIPPVPKSHMDPSGDEQQLAAGAVLDLRALDAYIARLLALLHACAK